MKQSRASLTKLAQGRIQISMQRLAGDYPFHVGVLERFELQPEKSIGTMAVTVNRQGIRLLFCPEFVLSLSFDELSGVLLHEVHHVVFRHVTADPKKFPDQWARTVAEEVTANEFVTLPLPGSPIRLEAFPSLPPMESTQERYERLTQLDTRARLEFLAAQHGEGVPPKSGEQSSGESKGQKPIGTVLDNHAVWTTGRDDSDQAQDIVRAVLQDVAIELGVAKIPQHFKRDLSAWGIGPDPNAREHALGGHSPGEVNWIRILRRYVGQHFAIRPDFCRPSRRCPHLVGIVPGRRRRASRPHIMAVIDTSASLTPDLLEQIAGELKRMAVDHSVTLVQCDAKIQWIGPLQKMTAFRGRGGTDLRPPFKADLLRKHRPDLIVYFTDGNGQAPKHPPKVPVVWCLTHKGRAPVKWGRVIRMPRC